MQLLKTYFIVITVLFCWGNLPTLLAQTKAQTQTLRLTGSAYRTTIFYDLATALKTPERVYRLDLSNMKLKTFPTEIFQFPNLQYLNLSSNRIKTLPKEINHLRNLRELTLSQNNIQSLPDEIGDLIHLEKLQLYRNSLTKFPIGIVGLKNLVYLDVTRNNLLEFELDYVTEKLPRCQILY